MELDQFRAFQRLIAVSYPALHSVCSREELDEFGVILTWRGSRQEMKPGILLAHYDVVGVDAESRDLWTHHPFAGEISDGYVWGRGTLDDKGIMIALLEAAEELASSGYTPERTLYFAFGGDEETTGQRGATRIAALFQERGIEAEFVLDEGSIVSIGMLPAVKAPIALVGISEKGYADVVLEARGDGGHASMPPPHTAAGKVARAVSLLEKRPFPAHIDFSVRSFLRALAPHVPPVLRAVFRFPLFWSPLLKVVFSGNPQTSALVRTTQACTKLEGSPASNVLPILARAVVNVRIRPGESVESVLSRMRNVVRDPDVNVALEHAHSSSEPVGESDIHNRTFSMIAESIRTVFPEAVVAPFPVTVTTDSKHYRHVTKNIYRFVPLVLDSSELGRIHGVDERISITNWGACIDFYRTAIPRLGGGQG